jgi:hypothetical protein
MGGLIQLHGLLLLPTLLPTIISLAGHVCMLQVHPRVV